MNRLGRQVLAVGVAVAGIALTTSSAAFADPVHFDGRAHVRIAAGRSAQPLQYPIVERLSQLTAQVPAQVAAQPLSHQVYVDPAGTTPDAGRSRAATGVWSVATLVWSGIASLVTGLGISLLCHRWTTRHSLVRSTRRDTPTVK